MLTTLRRLLRPTVRDKVVKWAEWGRKNEPRIHYQETRPMPLTAQLPLTTDCSGFVTLCYKLAGAPDPNGLGYNGQGYTGTLLQHGRHIPKAAVQPGDVVVYGPGTGWHTALIVKGGADPLTISHGEESGPEYCRVSQDGRIPQTYLRFPTDALEAAYHKPHGPLVIPAKRKKTVPLREVIPTSTTPKKKPAPKKAPAKRKPQTGTSDKAA